MYFLSRKEFTYFLVKEDPYMQLNVSTCYAMQIVLFLTRNNRIVSSTELAENLNISQGYILQIAGKLRNGGLIGTRTGMSGGYSLSKEAAEFSVYDVVTLMEGDMSIPHCIAPCKHALLHDALSVLKDYFDSYFKAVTFDRLAETSTKGQLSEIIGMVGSHIVEMREKGE